jgi:hypothetical protein
VLHLIYVPLTVSLFVSGETGKGIAWQFGGLGVIGLGDNFFDFY